MSMLRAFIAIELPGDLQKAISQVIQLLQNKAGKPGVRWVAAENIHLTLKFLGDVSPAAVAAIQDSLGAEVSLHPTFSIKIGGLGTFPNQKRPRVIWLGVEAPPELDTLQRGVESATTKLGYLPEDRPFSPHLTLGRVRETASASELAALTSTLKEIKIDTLGVISVEKIHLFKSELQPGGSVYTRLYSAPLLPST
jgi:RNA 2',3'-cyclic 3'-phosphodiesterase